MISVVIPCYKSKETIGKCLEHVLRGLDGVEAEVIVVCNGVDDSSVAIARTFPVQVVELAAAGRSRARNYGAKLARGEILVFIDADNYVEPDFFRHLLRPFSHTWVHAVEGASIPTGDRWVDRAYRHERFVTTQGTFLCLRKESPVYPLINTSACAYRRHSFMKVGGFNEALAELEDADLSRKVSLLGGVLYGEAKARSVDVMIGGVFHFFRRGFFHGRSYFRYQSLWSEVRCPKFRDTRYTMAYFACIMLGWWWERIFELKKLAPYPQNTDQWVFVMFPDHFEAMNRRTKKKYTWLNDEATRWEHLLEDESRLLINAMLAKLKS